VTLALAAEITNAHQQAVLSVSFSTNGKMLASGSQDKDLKLWGDMRCSYTRMHDVLVLAAVAAVLGWLLRLGHARARVWRRCINAGTDGGAAKRS
jgi:WD40 repeat protein